LPTLERLEELKQEILACRACEKYLPNAPKPIIQISGNAKIVIIGQAPGQKAHDSGIPWNDASGRTLRKWLGVTEEQFYNPAIFALLPMGFCFPGKGKTGDLAPRKECAPRWHKEILSTLKPELILLIGKYAQDYYLNDGLDLTERVRNAEFYLPLYFPLPHPSPRNQFWLKKNQWFEEEILLELREILSLIAST
jgi:uracil-DNA glycosylase family 4